MAAAAAALVWLAAACLLLAAQVRAAPVPLVPPDAATQPLGTLPLAGPARPGLGAASGTRVPARAARGPAAPAVTLRACPRPGSLLLLESPLRRRSVPRGSEVWGTLFRPPALPVHLGVSDRRQGRSCQPPWPRPGGCPSPTLSSPCYVRCQRPPPWLRQAVQRDTQAVPGQRPGTRRGSNFRLTFTT